MPTIWLTYSWDDNRFGDVDFLAQELVEAGVDVRLDRWTLAAGSLLWDRIAHFIQEETECDGWALYATQASLGSSGCREELAYALDRALEARGSEFPIIGMFPGPVDRSLIPTAVRVRLCVSTTDPDWKERIKAAAEGRPADVTRPAVAPYQVRLHSGTGPIEVRPRAGTWSPFFVAVPIAERETVQPSIMRGPNGRVPRGGTLTVVGDPNGISSDGQFWMIQAQDEATPTQSYFVFVRVLPSRLAFGVYNGQPQYLVEIPRVP